MVAQPVPVAKVAPMIIPPGAASPAAAIQTVNADAKAANLSNNMQIGGWVPNPKTKVVKSKKAKNVGGRGGGGGDGSAARRRRRRSYRTRRNRSSAFDARVSRRLRLRMLQRRIKKRKSRRRTLLEMQRGGVFVPQHGTSCQPGQSNCPGNTTQALMSVNAQAVANSRGDKLTS
jgi:hypothetical protein